MTVLRSTVVTAAVISCVVVLGAMPVSNAGALRGPGSSPVTKRLSRVVRPYDSCDIKQSDSSALDSTYEVTVRGFPDQPLFLSAPDGWACHVEDGNGSGASVEIFSPSAKADSYGERNGIDVAISANVRDGIGESICPYSTYKPRLLVYPCDAANSKRPAGVSVTYLAGSSTSRSVVVMVTTPANVTPPAYAPDLGHIPTVSVLAVVGSQFDAWMNCRIGSALSSTCQRDARAFADAVEASPPFS
jgi:hypothetical protein